MEEEADDDFLLDQIDYSEGATFSNIRDSSWMNMSALNMSMFFNPDRLIDGPAQFRYSGDFALEEEEPEDNGENAIFVGRQFYNIDGNTSDKENSAVNKQGATFKAPLLDISTHPKVERRPPALLLDPINLAAGKNVSNLPDDSSAGSLLSPPIKELPTTSVETVLPVESTSNLDVSQMLNTSNDCIDPNFLNFLNDSYFSDANNSKLEVYNEVLMPLNASTQGLVPSKGLTPQRLTLVPKKVTIPANGGRGKPDCVDRRDSPPRNEKRENNDRTGKINQQPTECGAEVPPSRRVPGMRLRQRRARLTRRRRSAKEKPSSQRQNIAGDKEAGARATDPTKLCRNRSIATANLTPRSPLKRVCKSLTPNLAESALVAVYNSKRRIRKRVFADLMRENTENSGNRNKELYHHHPPVKKEPSSTNEEIILANPSVNNAGNIQAQETPHSPSNDIAVDESVLVKTVKPQLAKRRRRVKIKAEIPGPSNKPISSSADNNESIRASTSANVGANQSSATGSTEFRPNDRPNCNELLVDIDAAAALTGVRSELQALLNANELMESTTKHISESFLRNELSAMSDELVVTEDFIKKFTPNDDLATNDMVRKLLETDDPANTSKFTPLHDGNDQLSRPGPYFKLPRMPRVSVYEKKITNWYDLIEEDCARRMVPVPNDYRRPARYGEPLKFRFEGVGAAEHRRMARRQTRHNRCSSLDFQPPPTKQRRAASPLFSIRVNETNSLPVRKLARSLQTNMSLYCVYCSREFNHNYYPVHVLRYHNVFVGGEGRRVLTELQKLSPAEIAKTTFKCELCQGEFPDVRQWFNHRMEKHEDIFMEDLEKPSTSTAALFTPSPNRLGDRVVTIVENIMANTDQGQRSTTATATDESVSWKDYNDEASQEVIHRSAERHRKASTSQQFARQILSSESEKEEDNTRVLRSRRRRLDDAIPTNANVPLECNDNPNNMNNDTPRGIPRNTDDANTSSSTAASAPSADLTTSTETAPGNNSDYDYIPTPLEEERVTDRNSTNSPELPLCYNNSQDHPQSRHDEAMPSSSGTENSSSDKIAPPNPSNNPETLGRASDSSLAGVNCNDEVVTLRKSIKTEITVPRPPRCNSNVSVVTLSDGEIDFDTYDLPGMSAFQFGGVGTLVISPEKPLLQRSHSNDSLLSIYSVDNEKTEKSSKKPTETIREVKCKVENVSNLEWLNQSTNAAENPKDGNDSNALTNADELQRNVGEDELVQNENCATETAENTNIADIIAEGNLTEVHATEGTVVERETSVGVNDSESSMSPELGRINSTVEMTLPNSEPTVHRSEQNEKSDNDEFSGSSSDLSTSAATCEPAPAANPIDVPSTADPSTAVVESNTGLNECDTGLNKSDTELNESGTGLNESGARLNDMPETISEAPLSRASEEVAPPIMLSTTMAPTATASTSTTSPKKNSVDILAIGRAMDETADLLEYKEVVKENHAAMMQSVNGNPVVDISDEPDEEEAPHLDEYSLNVPTDEPVPTIMSTDEPAINASDDWFDGCLEMTSSATAANTTPETATCELPVFRITYSDRNRKKKKPTSTNQPQQQQQNTNSIGQQQKQRQEQEPSASTMRQPELPSPEAPIPSTSQAEEVRVPPNNTNPPQKRYIQPNDHAQGDGRQSQESNDHHPRLQKQQKQQSVPINHNGPSISRNASHAVKNNLLSSMGFPRTEENLARSRMQKLIERARNQIRDDPETAEFPAPSAPKPKRLNKRQRELILEKHIKQNRERQQEQLQRQQQDRQRQQQEQQQEWQRQMLIEHVKKIHLREQQLTGPQQQQRHQQPQLQQQLQNFDGANLNAQCSWQNRSGEPRPRGDLGGHFWRRSDESNRSITSDDALERQELEELVRAAIEQADYNDDEDTMVASGFNTGLAQSVPHQLPLSQQPESQQQRYRQYYLEQQSFQQQLPQLQQPHQQQRPQQLQQQPYQQQRPQQKQQLYAQQRPQQQPYQQHGQERHLHQQPQQQGQYSQQYQYRQQQQFHLQMPEASYARASYGSVSGGDPTVGMGVIDTRMLTMTVQTNTAEPQSAVFSYINPTNSNTTNGVDNLFGSELAAHLIAQLRGQQPQQQPPNNCTWR